VLLSSLDTPVTQQGVHGGLEEVVVLTFFYSNDNIFLAVLCLLLLDASQYLVKLVDFRTCFPLYFFLSFFFLLDATGYLVEICRLSYLKREQFFRVLLPLQYIFSACKNVHQSQP